MLLKWTMAARRWTLDDFAPVGAGPLFDHIVERLGRGPTWAIYADCELAGIVAVIATSEVAAEIHITLGFRHWGRDVARQAAAAVVKELFETTTVRKISAPCFAGNTMAEGLASRLGFTREACFRSQTMRGGAPADVAVWGLTKEDWISHELSIQQRQHDQPKQFVERDEHPDVHAGPERPAERPAEQPVGSAEGRPAGDLPIDATAGDGGHEQHQPGKRRIANADGPVSGKPRNGRGRSGGAKRSRPRVAAARASLGT